MRRARTISVIVLSSFVLGGSYYLLSNEGVQAAPGKTLAASAGAEADAEEGAVVPLAAGDATSDANTDEPLTLEERLERGTRALGISEDELERRAQTSVEQLDEELGALKETAEVLRTDTLALQEQHSALLSEGKLAEADALVQDEIMPLYEQRQDLVREAVVLVRAKAQASAERNL